MASSKVEVPPEIRDLIKSFHPSEKLAITGVLDLMDNDFWRGTHRRDFGVIDGVQTWALAEAGFTVAFTESPDSVSIFYLSKRSLMRPSWL